MIFFSYIFIIDYNLFIKDPSPDGLAISNLWKEFFNYLINNNNIDLHNIFVHNLGGFDGYFIYKQLSLFYPEFVKTLIDDNNKFILIEWLISSNSVGQNKNIRIKFLDSFRIFPVSLNELCNIFEIKGKLNEYKQEYNNFNILNSNLRTEFLNYADQD